jgi:hypothetical protein
MGCWKIQFTVTPAPVFTGINSSGGPDAVPANAGNQKHIKLGSCFHRKPWIPASAGMTPWDSKDFFGNLLIDWREK